MLSWRFFANSKQLAQYFPKGTVSYLTMQTGSLY